MSITQITDLVCEQTGVPASAIHSPSKTLPVVLARRLLIHRLTQAGKSGQQIADHLGISRRSVCKHLSKYRNTHPKQP